VRSLAQLHFFERGVEVALCRRDARNFAVRIPFVGPLLDVHLEYRKSFVLFSLNLQLPSVDMQLEAARNSQRFLFGCLGFLFLAKRSQISDLFRLFSKRSSF